MSKKTRVTTEAKSAEIIQMLLTLVNKDIDPMSPCGPKIQLGPDWGHDNAMTLYVDDTHTHIGGRGATFAQFVDRLHKALTHLKDEDL